MKRIRCGLKRMLAGILCVAMTVTGVPGNVFAEGTSDVSAGEEFVYDTESSVSGSELPEIKEDISSDDISSGDIIDTPEESVEAGDEDTAEEDVSENDPGETEEFEEADVDCKVYFEIPEGVHVYAYTTAEVDSRNVKISGGTVSEEPYVGALSVKKGSYINFVVKPDDGKDDRYTFNVLTVDASNPAGVFCKKNIDLYYEDENSAFLTKQNYYPIDGILGDLYIKIEVVSHDTASRVYITKDKGIDKITVKSGGKEISFKNSDYPNPRQYYPVEEGSTVTVSVTTKNGYTLTGIYKTKPDEKKIEYKNGKATLTIKDDTYLDVRTQGEITLYACPYTEDMKAYNDKATIKAGALTGPYCIYVYEGDRFSGELQKIDSFTEKLGNKEVRGYATIMEDGKGSYLAVNTRQIASDEKITDKLTVKVKGSFGTRTLTFDVAKRVTSVTVKGAKKNKITQTAGTTVSYDISLNKNADWNTFTVSCVADPHWAGDVQLDRAKKKITVSTYGDDELPKNGSFKIGFYDTENGKEITSYEVNLTKPTLKAPTVKVSEITDVDMQISITPEKTTKKYKNVWYLIEAKAVGELKENMRSEYSTLEKAKAGKICFDLSDYYYGCGHAQKYNITVTPVQLYDASSAVPSAAEDNIFARGKAVKLTKSTKEPCYEYSLSLTKKNTSVTAGDEKLLAVAKYSDKTTYYAITDAELLNSCGAKAAYLEVVNNNEIWLPKDTYVAPGKYKIMAYASTDNAYPATATLAVTVKAPVTDIKLTASNLYVYKAKNKAATLKVKAQCLCEIDGENYKPANSKVKWKVEATKDTELSKYLSISKDGLVTVKKGYKVNADSEFKVYAYSADGHTSKYMYFTITDEPTVPGSMSIGSVEGQTLKGNVTAVPADELTGYHITVYEKADPGVKKEIDREKMTVSVTPKTGMSIDPDDFCVTMTKAGTYTVKVTMKDGSGSLSAKFACKYDTIDHYETDISVYDPLGSPSTIKWDESTVNPKCGSIDTPCEYIAIVVYADPVRNGSDDYLCDNKATVELKNAKKVDYDMYSCFGIRDIYGFKRIICKPTGENVEIKVSYKLNGVKKTETYKIKVPMAKKTMTAASKEYTVLSCRTSGEDKLSFKIPNVKLKDPYVRFTLPDSTLKADEYKIYYAASLCNELNLAFRKCSIDTKKKTALVTVGPRYSAIKKGSYDICASLWDNVEGTGVQITKPVKIKVKVTDTPAPKIQLNSNVKIKDDKGSEATIGFKTIKDCGPIKDSIVCINYNDKGNIEDFSKHFEALLSSTGDEIVLKRTNSELPEGKKTFKGVIKYTVYTVDKQEVVITDNITVTIE